MYDYTCEEFPFFKVDTQNYPSKAQQVHISSLMPRAFCSWRMINWCECLLWAASLHRELPAWVRPGLWQPERRAPDEAERGAVCGGEQVSLMSNLTSMKIILSKCFFLRSAKLSLRLFLWVGSHLHLTSFGACGPSSKRDCQPLSLDTWWAFSFYVQG